MEAMSHCPLQQLTLVECNELDYNMFAPLTRCSSTLTSLNITNCSLHGLESRDPAQQAVPNLMRLHHLTSLKIYCNRRDYYPFINALFADLPSMVPWPELTSLYLGAFTVMDTVAIALLQAQPKLTRVGLVDSQITDKTLDAIATYLPEVVELEFMGSKGITPDGLRRLLKTCRKLESVGCNNCEIYPSDFPELDDTKMYTDDDLDEPPVYVLYLMGEAFVGDIGPVPDIDYESGWRRRRC
ncbi:hypothetical protein BCR42DRAFT_428076 [Absidia repens]|uniref:F-box domain-containing protein n=1 Tax=Absidia repens TaxID=90262 RepID=A0A1X2HYW9_9FUNG|nr:hypothetical protein BCR42DRAFT_428076 [Absidia repens]